jgi:uncharacterized SAM-binding protein YcdF (DUF218 family)
MTAYEPPAMEKLCHSTTETPVTSSRPQVWDFQRRLVLSFLIIALCIGAWLGSGLLLRVMAQSWMVSDSLGAADAVAVFGGSVETRPLAAAGYYRKGLVKRVLVANNSSLDTSVNRSVLLGLGVPDTDIDIFGSRLSNTYEEALALREWAVGTGARAVIVPTEAIPSRRVHWVLQHVFAGTGILVLVPVHHPPEEAGVEWWKDEKLLVTFRTEVLKYVYYRLRY